MYRNETRLPQDIYCETLTTIGGITFTPREIDAISFIVSGRTTKKIASFLSISPKTVDNHIHNIMMKLDCHSREHIIDFIERAGKFPVLRQYYLSLLVKEKFKNKLKHIAFSLREKTPACVIVCCYPAQSAPNAVSPLIERLKRHLKLAGIRVSLKSMKQVETLSRVPRDSALHTVFMLTGTQLKALEGDGEEPSRSSFYELIQRSKQHLGSFTLVLGERGLSLGVPEPILGSEYVDFRASENYYLSTLTLLKRIGSAVHALVDFDKIIADFIKEASLIGRSSDKIPLPPWVGMQKVLQVAKGYSVVQYFLRIKKRGVVILACLSLTSLPYGLFLMHHNNDSPKTMTPLIRSDLIIPFEDTMLERPDLISQLEESFKRAQPLKTTALVGVAGSGKTTLARHYVRKQNASVIWEINAETKETLVDSFETLVSALATTEDDRKTLRELQEIKDSKKKEAKIFQFVKERLKAHKDWILIYDNVETFADFQKYLPQDNGTWGQGKVIVTTRDSNIQNMRTIAQVIEINELTEDEKLSLFTKILNHGLPHLSASQEEIKAFLTFLPPFPLDISVAAYYIKSTRMSYDKYLKRLKDQRKDFIVVQENILKGANDYPKVRYSIITLSLDQLMELHKDFPYLLLFISLIDSQNIPRELLETPLNAASVDNFIFNLNKYSLITNHSSAVYPWGTTFSVHRSTQEISLLHLKKRLGLNPETSLIHQAARTLENYGTQRMEKEDLSQLRLLTNHCEVLLSHRDLLTEGLKGSLSGNLGGMYLSLGKYTQAKKFLKHALVKFKHDTSHPHKRAQALAYLGNVYGEIGRYEKAKELLEASLLLYQKQLSPKPAGMAWTLTYLGNVYRDLGNHKKAKDLLEQSLQMYKTSFFQNYAGSARASAYLGIIHTLLGEFEQAKTLLEQSLRTYKGHFSEGHVGVAWVLAHLGNAYGELRNYGKARALLEESITLYKNHFHEDHIKVGWALSYLGDVYRVLGEYEKAKQALEKSMAIYKKHLPENHIVIAGILVYLSNVHKDLGEYEKARHLLEHSLAIYTKYFPENHTETAWALTHLGDIYRIMGDFEKAKEVLEKSLSIYRKHFSEDHTEVVWALGRLKDTMNKDRDHKKIERLN